jgi:cytochrome c oxidase subunit II
MNGMAETIDPLPIRKECSSMRKLFIKNKTLLLVATVVIFSGISPLLPTASAQAGVKKIEITAKRFEYTPGEITLKKGEPVVLVVKSLDVGHGLRVKELNIDLKVKKGETTEVQVTPEKTGDFVGHCSVFCGPGHGSMKMTIHVVE